MYENLIYEQNDLELVSFSKKYNLKQKDYVKCAEVFLKEVFMKENDKDQIEHNISFGLQKKLEMYVNIEAMNSEMKEKSDITSVIKTEPVLNGPQKRKLMEKKNTGSFLSNNNEYKIFIENNAQKYLERGCLYYNYFELNSPDNVFVEFLTHIRMIKYSKGNIIPEIKIDIYTLLLEELKLKKSLKDLQIFTNYQKYAKHRK